MATDGGQKLPLTFGFHAFRDHVQVQTLRQCHDGTCNGGIVGVGQQITHEDLIDLDLGHDPLAVLANFSVALSCNGELRENGTGANVLGSPLSAVAHLIAAIETQAVRRPLQAGELITTGTLTAAFPLHAGETWRTEIQGIALPGLAVTFTD